MMIVRSDLYDTETIKQSVNIRQVVELYGLQLDGNKCCCPFHKDKTPSFYINEKKNIFKCFGCGIGGDIFTFVQKVLDCDFKTALTEIVNVFRLGNTGKLSNETIIIRDEEKRKKQQFDVWCSNVYTVLTDYYRELKNTIDSETILDICNISSECENAFKKIDFIDYLIEALRLGDKIEFYKLYRKEVTEIVNRRNSGCAK